VYILRTIHTRLWVKRWVLVVQAEGTKWFKGLMTTKQVICCLQLQQWNLKSVGTNYDEDTQNILREEQRFLKFSEHLYSK